MSLKVYGTLSGPPFRSTVFTIKALDIEVDFEEVNIAAGDQLKPEFLKLNPFHTVPTLKDGDFVIWESHVINAYLVGKYGKDDSLYSKDLQKRAVIDQGLYFDATILFPRFADIAHSLIGKEDKTINQEKADLLVKAYASLEILLERSTYVAGEQLSIADFNIIATLTSAAILIPVDANKFPKTTAWMSKMEELPYYAAANEKGLEMLADLMNG